MSEWAPLVHGRTAYVDFRSNFIVFPNDFGPADLTWAKQHVLATTQTPDALPGRPRWCVFRDEARTVVGVTCMAEDISRTHHREVELTSEGARSGHRRLYVFLGLVSNDAEARLPPMEIDLFRDLYRYVIDRWEEREYESRGLHQMPYCHALETLADDERPSVALNSDDDRIVLWPCDRNEDLWQAADTDFGSVAINFPSARVALGSPFRDVTAVDVHERRVEPRAEIRKQRREPPSAEPLGSRTGAWAPTSEPHTTSSERSLPPRTDRSRNVPRNQLAGLTPGRLLAVALWIPRTAVACLGAMFHFTERIAAKAFGRSDETSSVGSIDPAVGVPPPVPDSILKGYRHRASSANSDPTRSRNALGLDATEPRAPARRSHHRIEERHPPAEPRRSTGRQTVRSERSDRSSPPSAAIREDLDGSLVLDALSAAVQSVADKLRGSPTQAPRLAETRRSARAEEGDSTPPGFRRRRAPDVETIDPGDVWGWKGK